MTNHLIQSTAFAACVAVLVWGLRNHRASIRYALWFSASFKFLIPFSVFVSLGQRAEPAVAPLAPAIAAAAHPLTVPFAEIIRTGAPPVPFNWMPWILAVWTCGVLAIVTMRVRSWRSVRNIVRTSLPCPRSFPVEVRTSSGALEPGLVGFWRCTIVLPEDIEHHLTTSQLDAVLAHELCHAERRDNLFAAVHMVVEALFWFHPLVWWIGARLAETRELSCDEAVLAGGGNPRDYADAILSVCKRYAGSPLPCVSGVTGADLRKRIEAMFSRRAIVPLSSSKRVLLAASVAIAVLAPFVAGIGKAQSSKSFEVASVHLAPDARRFAGTGLGAVPRLVGDRFEYTGTVRSLIVRAFNVVECEGCEFVQGGPDWIDHDMYRIDAKLPEGTPRYNNAEFSLGEAESVYQMLQSLLAERFRLKVHRETKEAPVYTMTVAPGGHKLTPTAGKTMEYRDGTTTTTRLDRRRGIVPLTEARYAGRLRMTVTCFTLQEIADDLSSLLDRPVFDRTGVSGRFDFSLDYDSDSDQSFPPKVGGPSLIAAFGKQLGLRLESKKGPVEVLMIDSVERPSGN